MATLEHQLAALVERLAFGILPLDTLVIRLSHTVSPFFLAPGVDRRLVPLATGRAWLDLLRQIGHGRNSV